MTRQLGSMGLVPLVLLAACSPNLGAPFPAYFYTSSSDQFKFVAVGTSDYRANTLEGEKARIAWLEGYLARNNMCPRGYDILSRKKEPPPISVRKNVEEQSFRSIIYVGRCRSTSSVKDPP
jgi:hypothetical protein